MVDSTDKIIKNSLGELKLASIATAVVLALSFFIYISIPSIRSYFSEKDIEISHSRIYNSIPGGAEIIYTVSENHPDPGSEKKRLNGLKKDLEILSRRFTRGNFDLLSIPGSADSDQVKNMVPFKNDFAYSVSTDEKSARLAITTRNPAAKKALTDYITYMKERWKPEN